MKTFNTIFVSSTFRDMDIERDLIQDRIIPRINMEAAQYGQSVSVSDLRWGIDTGKMDEAEATKKVLNVCLDEIDRTDQPIIVLIGDRYGWIPPEEAINRISEERGFHPETGKLSTTALEIEYGLFLEKNANVSLAVENDMVQWIHKR